MKNNIITLKMKVAIVHYWLVGMRGGEKVLEALCEIFPNADIYTHVYDPKAISEKLKKHDIQTTFVQKLPFAKKWYSYYLPFMPMALENLDLTQYDLIISSESGPAKGIIPSPNATHICYAHSPMRYAWDMFHTYWGDSHWLKRLPISIIMHYLRIWDSNCALRTDFFIANSSFIAQRINKYYRRQAKVIHPPVDIEQFLPIENPRSDYYLWLGELTKYKRPMDAVQAFNDSGKKLIMVGKGELEKILRAKTNDNISLKSKVCQEELLELFQNCRALIYSGIEDFGIIPVEVMACGRPVIAYNQGGATDSVLPGITGVLYEQLDSQGLNQGIVEFETIEHKFDPNLIRQHSEHFSKQRFVREFEEFLVAIDVKS